MELTAEQRDRIRRLLEAELRAAVRSAATRGARPAEVAALVAERRRRLSALRPIVADHPQDPGDGVAERLSALRPVAADHPQDPGGGVGERRRRLSALGPVVADHPQDPDGEQPSPYPR